MNNQHRSRYFWGILTVLCINAMIAILYYMPKQHASTLVEGLCVGFTFVILFVTFIVSMGMGLGDYNDK